MLGSLAWFDGSSSSTGNVAGWTGYGDVFNPISARSIRWTYRGQDCINIFRVGNRASQGNGSVPYDGSPNKWLSWRVILIENN